MNVFDHDPLGDASGYWVASERRSERSMWQRQAHTRSSTRMASSSCASHSNHINNHRSGYQAATSAEASATGNKLIPSYPLLYKLGLWFASIPLSAVAAESAIGLMREIETPKRNRIKEPSWQAENFLRYNKWLAQLEFDDVLRQVNATEAGIRSRNPAAAAAAAATVNAAPF